MTVGASTLSQNVTGDLVRLLGSGEEPLPSRSNRRNCPGPREERSWEVLEMMELKLQLARDIFLNLGIRVIKQAPPLTPQEKAAQSTHGIERSQHMCTLEVNMVSGGGLCTEHVPGW